MELDWPAMLDRAADLCRVAATPNLAGRGVYLCRATELPGFAGDCWCGAMTSPSLDLLLRDHLGPAWHGRGFAAVLNDRFIERDAKSVREVEYAVYVVALHELAHPLAENWGLLWDDDAAPADRTEDVAAFARNLAVEPTPRVKDVWVAETHRPHDFGRVACHLVYRLVERTGVYLLPYEVWADSGPKFASAYYRHLMPEMKAMADRPFAEILAAAPPPEFVKLCSEFDSWHAGQSAWLTSVTQGKDSES